MPLTPLDLGASRIQLAPTTTTLLVTVVAVALWRLYLALLPKPIPGIPHNRASARNPLGDIPGFVLASARTREPITWLLSQARATGSPISQIFLAPFGGRPFVTITDFRETQDILLRRGREFDRSSILIDTLGVALPHHHIVRKTDAGWRAQRRLLQDLMLPKFLDNVAAPNIYASVEQLVSLWKEKTVIAAGRPFNADRDIYFTALDAVLDFSFGGSFAHRAVKPQLDALLKMDEAGLQKLRGVAGSMDKPVEFVDAPLHETVVATLDSGDVVEVLQSSPFPRLMLWWKKRDPHFVKTWDTKNQFLEDEIKKAMDRMQQQAEASDESWVMSAVDHIVFRERCLAEKEGREPVYWSPIIRDEVRVFPHPPENENNMYSPHNHHRSSASSSPATKPRARPCSGASSCSPTTSRRRPSSATRCKRRTPRPRPTSAARQRPRSPARRSRTSTRRSRRSCGAGPQFPA